MTIVLPYPPSANKYWHAWRGRVVKSDHAREYQRSVRLRALVAGALRPLSGSVVLDIVVYRPRQIGDLDNCLKVALDALKGIVFIDDRQVVEFHARRRDDPKNPRMEVSAREESQEELLARERAR